MKKETNKPWWNHVSLWPVESAVQIITDQAIKHKEEIGSPNWHNLPDGKRKYQNALMRHVVAMIGGEEVDESGHSHLSHIIANCLILGEL